jgi:hypothetical protein
MKALRLEDRSIITADIENTLDAFQEAVDGYIETVTLVQDRAVMLVNEEGLLRDLPLNPVASAVANTQIVGTAIVVGVDGEEFTDIPEDVERCIKALFA